MKSKMKSIFLIIAFLLCQLPIKAQKDLQVGAAFERFGREKGCKMVVLNNTTLRGYKLQVYKSLTYKRIGNRIKPYLQGDRKKAKKIREIIFFCFLIHMCIVEGLNLHFYCYLFSTSKTRLVLRYSLKFSSEILNDFPILSQGKSFL